MPRRIIKTTEPRKVAPYLDPKLREDQLIAEAVDLAERQLLEGTASSQVITHFLRLGTEQAKLEREKLKKETELLEEKKKAIKSAERSEALFAEAIEAMKRYSGENSN